MICKFNLRLYTHLSQVLVGTAIFIVGDLTGNYIYNNIFNDTKLFLFSILFFIVKTVTPLKNNLYICDLSIGFLGIAIVILGARFLNVCKYKILHRVLIFIGNYSLESYLYNIFLIQAVKYFEINGKLKIFKNILINKIVIYIGIAILGLILSIFTKKIIDFFRKRYKE